MVLPETGGSGVLIYYAVGAMLCMGAVLNFYKKKYHKEKNNIFIKRLSWKAAFLNVQMKTPLYPNKNICSACKLMKTAYPRKF